jgi:hypothetical protein
MCVENTMREGGNDCMILIPPLQLKELALHTCFMLTIEYPFGGAHSRQFRLLEQRLGLASKSIQVDSVSWE